nr:SDR family NAD(P)-dependent oxidoreductase [uncultured Pseudomonas sp.]
MPTSTNVIVVIGAGSIGQAVARRVSDGKHVVLADLKQDNADAAARVLLDAGFKVTTCIVDVGSRESIQALVTGSDFLMDGGVTTAYWYGDLAPE